MINKNMPVKAGFVGFGEVNTPDEFIVERCAEAARAIERAGLKLHAVAPVRDDAGGTHAARAVAELAKNDFDLLVLCVAGWIPSWAVLSAIEPFRHKPMVLLGLSGRRQGGRFITTADQAGTTALRKPMEDMGYTFKYLPTYMGQKPRIAELATYARAAQAATLLRKARIGMAGCRDMRLYGTGYDAVSLKAGIGPEIEHFELLEIAQLMEKAGKLDIKRIVASLGKRWKFLAKPKPGTIENTARLFLAFKQKILDRHYQALSYNDVDGVKKLLKFAPAGAMTLLHDELDICSVPENDSLGAVTQLMVKFITGQSAAYLEFYEFLENGALMGVPDYVPAGIVEGRVRVRPTSFGGFGEGLLNVSRLRTGKATICRLGYSRGEYGMHIMTGAARAPGRWEEAGWAQPAPQLPGLEMIFDAPVGEFTQKVMSQHYIISYGDNRAGLEDLCSILGVKIV